MNPLLRALAHQIPTCHTHCLHISPFLHQLIVFLHFDTLKFKCLLKMGAPPNSQFILCSFNLLLLLSLNVQIVQAMSTITAMAKDQIACNMCAECENPCQPILSPPPPSPPLPCPPPPSPRLQNYLRHLHHLLPHPHQSIIVHRLPYHPVLARETALCSL